MIICNKITKSWIGVKTMSTIKKASEYCNLILWEFTNYSYHDVLVSPMISPYRCE